MEEKEIYYEPVLSCKRPAMFLIITKDNHQIGVKVGDVVIGLKSEPTYSPTFSLEFMLRHLEADLRDNYQDKGIVIRREGKTYVISQNYVIQERRDGEVFYAIPPYYYEIFTHFTRVDFKLKIT